MTKTLAIAAAIFLAASAAGAQTVTRSATQCAGGNCVTTSATEAAPEPRGPGTRQDIVWYAKPAAATPAPARPYDPNFCGRGFLPMADGSCQIQHR